MNRKTLFRNLAIVAVILFAIWGFSLMRNSDREYTGVDTSIAMTQLDQKNVKSVQIDDREQRSQSDVFALLRPVFDVLWQAFGNDRSMNYDSKGVWQGDRTIRE